MSNKNDLTENLLKAIPDFVYVIDFISNEIVYLNHKTEVFANYKADEFLKLDIKIGTTNKTVSGVTLIEQIADLYNDANIGDTRNFHLEFTNQDNKLSIVRNRGTLLKSETAENAFKVIVFAEDITAYIENLRKDLLHQKQLNDAEQLFNYGSWEWVLKNDYVTWSNGLFDIFGYNCNDYPESKMIYGVYNQHIVPEDRRHSKELSLQAIADKSSFYEFEHEIIDTFGNRKLLHVRGKCFLDENGEVNRVLGTSEDITELKKLKNTLKYKIDELSVAYEELKKTKDLFKEAESMMSYGSFDWDVEKDEIQWSDGLKRVYGGINFENLPQKLDYNFYKSCLHEDDLSRVTDIVNQAIIDKCSYAFEHRLFDLDGVEKTVNTRGWVVTNEEGKVIRFIGNTVDITELKIYEKELENKIEELNKSNEQLEQFAYIASHDLQEPLRKIMAFGERLSSKFAGQLPDDGQFYVNRMLDAANRMKILMENLLSYSRASRKIEPVENVALNEVIEMVLSDFEVKIQETEAQIEILPLPTIKGLPTQMQQLFLNLISNALKFVQPNQKPHIKIESFEATKQELKGLNFPLKAKKYHKIVVSDKGIGFDAEYAEKIFIIFQRLHGRAEFEGTGLGLAICKKIIDNHDGYIKAESVLNEGAKFIVYLPNNN
ncbi:PAS domain-containing sensor histidine kinase [Arcicella aurantiaca]|uniref:PAS domain-containing sensor histidine kinase n=1 Tax=Arcicella aurantiaca TaxID=591202 RepID=UPI001304BBE7|nr:PAS domain-containing sensor histidine kinase [Arcicella aurantiaca]